MTNRTISSVIFIICVSMVWSSQSLPFEKLTHQAINENIAEKTIDGFSLNKCLVKEIGLLNGIKELLKIGSDERTVQKWLGIGGIKEDEPDGLIQVVAGRGRSNNHFHNPLGGPLLVNCGLDTTYVFHYTGQSSIRWAQNRNQDPGGKRSWYDAREYFYNGLTLTDKTERSSAMADCFRTLGQLIHLIQDASVPAHSRNQIHVSFNYEKWLEKIQSFDAGTFSTFIANPIAFDPSILTLDPIDSSAPVVIANIVDTGNYGGNNPEITAGTAIGIAEYTNANFFSERTIFSNLFPYPAKASTERRPYLFMDPRGSGRAVTREYYVKSRDGETNYRLATVGLLKYYITKYFPDSVLNEKEGLDGGVYNDYASRLLPRAVGYSGGLLKYFFRGQLEPIPTSSGVRIKNLSPEDMSGTFRIFYDSKDGPRKAITSFSISLSSGATSNPLSFSEPNDIANPGEYILVFRGQLGKEEDAVIGRVFSMKTYYWSIVAQCPPYDNRYSTMIEEVAWNDCGTGGSELLVTRVDICPGAEYVNAYLFGSDRSLPDINPRDRSRCEGTLTSKYVGQFTKGDVLSKINYSLHTAEHINDQVADNYGNLVCPVGGKMAYVLDDYEIYTETPLIPVHWGELPVNSTEINKIKEAMFPGYDLSAAFRASDFNSEGFGVFYNCLGSFSYAVTETMDAVAWLESVGVTFTKVGTIFELGSKRKTVEFRVSDSNVAVYPCW